MRKGQTETYTYLNRYLSLKRINIPREGFALKILVKHTVVLRATEPGPEILQLPQGPFQTEADSWLF